jgi:predicted permease
MNSFLFAVNAVAPIILMVALGYWLKKTGMIRGDLAKSLNKLVFRVFLPATLFLNVYKMDGFEQVEVGYILYALGMTLILFLVGIPVAMMTTKDSARRGPMVQVSYRSNFALVGLPLAQSLFGDEGGMVAALLSAAVIPLFNVLAVISLTVFKREEGKPGIKKILMGILKNPLIAGIVAGLVALGVRGIFAQCGIAFRLTDIQPVYRVLEYLSGLSTPLALLVLGAQFEFSAIKGLRREIITGVLYRTVLAPVLGVGVAYLFFGDRFGGAHFAAFVALFATPVAVSSLPMAQEMGNDAELAGQYVVWTTLVSALSIFLASLWLKQVGIF